MIRPLIRAFATWRSKRATILRLRRIDRRLRRDMGLPCGLIARLEAEEPFVAPLIGLRRDRS